MKTTGSTALKVGVTTFIAFIVLFGGVLWVKQYNPLAIHRTFTVAFADGMGITGGDPVTLAGLRIGQVMGTQLGENNRALVIFTVYGDVDIHPDAVFTIEEVGLMGDRALAVEPGVVPGTLNPDVVHDGSEGENLSTFMESASDVLNNLQSISKRLDQELDIASLTSEYERTMARIADAMAAYERIAEENRAPLQQTLASVDATADSVRQFVTANDERFVAMLESFRETSDRIERTMTDLGDVASSMDMRLESNQGTLAKLVNSEELYRELRHTNAQIDSFVTDIRVNPGRYTKGIKIDFKLF